MDLPATPFLFLLGMMPLSLQNPAVILPFSHPFPSQAPQRKTAGLNRGYAGLPKLKSHTMKNREQLFLDLYPLLLVFRSTTRQFTTQFDHGTVDWIVVFTFCSSRGSKARAAATSTSHKDWVTSLMPASPREILQTVGRPP